MNNNYLKNDISNSNYTVFTHFPLFGAFIVAPFVLKNLEDDLQLAMTTKENGHNLLQDNNYTGIQLNTI